jgi:RND family efflux transporter MFP subunit
MNKNTLHHTPQANRPSRAEHPNHPNHPNRLNRAWSAAALAGVVSLACLFSACGPAVSAGGGPGGPPPVSVAPVTQRAVQDFDDFTARLEAVNSVDIRSRVAGTLMQVHFQEGQRVAKGALLFSIDSRSFAAELARVQAQRSSARTQAELAAADLARAEKLLPLQAVSLQEIDQLRAARRNAQANVAALDAQLNSAELNLSYARITAPMAGQISRSNITAGNLVAAGDPVLTTLVATEKIYAWFDASEATYLRLSAARRAANKDNKSAPTVQLGLADEEGFPHKGTVDFVDNRLNPATGSIRVRAVFDNSQGRFTPGLSARLRLGSGAATNASLVPEKAISTDQTRKVVMVVGANNIVAPREVKLGALLNGMRVVTGVQAGENIIVDGLQRAFPGAPVTPTLLKVDALGMPMPAPPQGPPGADNKAPAAPASAPQAAPAASKG